LAKPENCGEGIFLAKNFSSLPNLWLISGWARANYTNHNYRTNLILSCAKPEHWIWLKWLECLVHTWKLRQLQQVSFLAVFWFSRIAEFFPVAFRMMLELFSLTAKFVGVGGLGNLAEGTSKKDLLGLWQWGYAVWSDLWGKILRIVITGEWTWSEKPANLGVHGKWLRERCSRQFLQHVSTAQRCTSYSKSIRPFIWLSHAGTVSKLLGLRSCGLHWRIAPWLLFPHG